MGMMKMFKIGWLNVAEYENQYQLVVGSQRVPRRVHSRVLLVCFGGCCRSTVAAARDSLCAWGATGLDLQALEWHWVVGSGW
jgi:hypothetical protein